MRHQRRTTQGPISDVALRGRPRDSLSPPQQCSFPQRMPVLSARNRTALRQFPSSNWLQFPNSSNPLGCAIFLEGWLNSSERWLPQHGIFPFYEQNLYLIAARSPMADDFMAQVIVMMPPPGIPSQPSVAILCAAPEAALPSIGPGQSKAAAERKDRIRMS